MNERESRPVQTPMIRRARGTALLALLAGAALLLTSCAPEPGTGSTDASSAPAAIEGDQFENQQPQWSSCGSGMQCAEVFAPLDWNNRAGERITLSLVKQPARNGKPQGTIFVNPGGPGASGVEFISESIDGAVGSDLQDAFDIIGWDPRGVGQSTPVRCLTDAEMDRVLFEPGPSDDLEEGTEAWLAAVMAEAAEYAAGCESKTGELYKYVDTQSTVLDLEMLRSVVRDDKLNYLGYSYGTYIGARYADTFPERVGKLVLDGAIDPAATEVDVVREQTKGFEAALRAYVTDCLTRKDCPVSGSVDEAMAQWGQLLDRVDKEPLQGSDGRTFSAGTMLTAIITPLYAQGNWPYLDDLFETVSKGETRVGFLLADFYHDRSADGIYLDNSNEAFTAINCLDYPSNETPDLAAMRAEAESLSALAPTIGKYQGYSGAFCAGWPAKSVDERKPVRGAGADPILVIGTTGDPATPYQWSVLLAKQLESGVLVSFQGEGHTAYGKSSCVSTLVDAYFLRGDVPASDPMCTK